MSFSRDARDNAASLFYLDQLNKVREDQLKRGVRGEIVADSELRQREDLALEKMKQEYFVREVRDIFLPPDKAAQLTDDQDFAARSTEMIEMTMLESHRLLADIPWVGHPDYQTDSEAP